MASKTKTINMAGNDLIVNRIITGVTSPAKGNIAIADTVATGAVLGRRNVVNITAASRTLTGQESGTLFLLNKSDGIAITLPALSTSVVGTWYEFQVNTSVVASDVLKWSTGVQGTDFFNGSLITADPDGSPAEATFVVTGNGSSHDNISMNGSTTGGLIGTCFRVVATSATTWTVFGVMAATGDTATPFATT